MDNSDGNTHIEGCNVLSTTKMTPSNPSQTNTNDEANTSDNYGPIRRPKPVGRVRDVVTMWENNTDSTASNAPSWKSSQIRNKGEERMMKYLSNIWGLTTDEDADIKSNEDEADCRKNIVKEQTVEPSNEGGNRTLKKFSAYQPQEDNLVLGNFEKPSVGYIKVKETTRDEQMKELDIPVYPERCGYEEKTIKCRMDGNMAFEERHDNLSDDFSKMETHIVKGSENPLKEEEEKEKEEEDEDNDAHVVENKHFSSGALLESKIDKEEPTADYVDTDRLGALKGTEGHVEGKCFKVDKTHEGNGDSKDNDAQINGVLLEQEDERYECINPREEEQTEELPHDQRPHRDDQTIQAMEYSQLNKPCDDDDDDVVSAESKPQNNDNTGYVDMATNDASPETHRIQTKLPDLSYTTGNKTEDTTNVTDDQNSFVQVESNLIEKTDSDMNRSTALPLRTNRYAMRSCEQDCELNSAFSLEQDCDTFNPLPTKQDYKTYRTMSSKKSPEKPGKLHENTTTHKQSTVTTPTQRLNPDDLYLGRVSDVFSDVGNYSYLMLVSAVTFILFEDTESDREFIEAFIVEAVGRHLGQPAPVIEAAITSSRGDGIQNTDPLVQSLREEHLVKKYGLQVVVFDLVDCILLQGGYDARCRTVVRLVSQLLKVDWDMLEQYEDLIMETLEDARYEVSEEEVQEQAAKEKKRKLKKYLMIGAMTVGGGTLIGVTGGLAAPLVIAGSSVAVGALAGSALGLAGGGLIGKKMQKRVGDLDEFDFEPLTEGRQLHITIAVSGWLTEENYDFKNTWRGLANSTEQYVLRYESKHLKRVGSSMGYFIQLAAKAATKEALKYTALATLVSAMAWPVTILAASNVIDNPWSVAMSRSALAGKALAQKLLERQQGKRPVTLMGFSLGARVIFFCLRQLAKRTGGAGIVEDVIMLGAPVPGNREDWQQLGSVVSGKIINGYCRGDWLLKFLYRSASVQLSIAGLDPIDWQDRRMHNMDLSEVVTGHLDYMQKIDEILEIVGVKTRPHVWDHQEDSLRQWCNLQRQGAIRDLRYNIGKEQTLPTKATMGKSEGSYNMETISEKVLEQSDERPPFTTAIHSDVNGVMQSSESVQAREKDETKPLRPEHHNQMYSEPENMNQDTGLLDEEAARKLTEEPQRFKWLRGKLRQTESISAVIRQYRTQSPKSSPKLTYRALKARLDTEDESSEELVNTAEHNAASEDQVIIEKTESWSLAGEDGHSDGQCQGKAPKEHIRKQEIGQIIQQHPYHQESITFARTERDPAASDVDARHDDAAAFDVGAKLDTLTTVDDVDARRKATNNVNAGRDAAAVGLDAGCGAAVRHDAPDNVDAAHDAAAAVNMNSILDSLARDSIKRTLKKNSPAGRRKATLDVMNPLAGMGALK